MSHHHWHGGPRFFRLIQSFLTSCFRLTGLVSRPVRQALALCTFKSNCRPFPVADAKAGTIVVAEFKLRDSALDVARCKNDMCLSCCA